MVTYCHVYGKDFRRRLLFRAKELIPFTVPTQLTPKAPPTWRLFFYEALAMTVWRSC